MLLKGFTGKTLWVDLTSGAIEIRPSDFQMLKEYIGGRGWGIRLLADLAPAGVDPLSPDNPLIFTTGPYTGIGVFSAFFNVTTKSPLTGISTSSHCGGHWGPRLKRAGFDGIVITGAAAKPVYLVIDEGDAQLKDASELWGLGSFATGNRLREAEEAKDAVVIGPAGEKLVRYAAIMSDHRAAGRSGVGAVMGSKKLKGIVVKGKLPLATAKPERVTAISRQGGKTAIANGKAFANYGSSIVFNFFNQSNMLPTKNFRGGHFADAALIDAEALKQNYFVKDRGCFNCPLRCGNVHAVKEGPYKLAEVEGPEYETMMSFGSNAGNANLESILMANWLCNDLGMDTISCGQVFALLMDLYDLGIISAQDLDGLEMNWGQHESMIALIPKIAAREGVGDLLAEGSLRAARHWGPRALERVIHAKGQEFPGYEARRSFGTGMSLVTSNRGADHLQATLYVNEMFMGQFEEKGYEANMAVHLDKEHEMVMADALCVCKFGMRNAGYNWEVMAELYGALTGVETSVANLKKAGERIWNLERLYNLREGVEDDMAPERFFREDLDDGQPGGERITIERFLSARGLYYAERGWDAQGHPRPDKLAELQISPLLGK